MTSYQDRVTMVRNEAVQITTPNAQVVVMTWNGDVRVTVLDGPEDDGRPPVMQMVYHPEAER